MDFNCQPFQLQIHSWTLLRIDNNCAVQWNDYIGRRLLRLDINTTMPPDAPAIDYTLFIKFDAGEADKKNVQPDYCRFLPHFREKFSCNRKVILLVKYQTNVQPHLCIEVQPLLCVEVNRTYPSPLVLYKIENLRLKTCLNISPGQLIIGIYEQSNQKLTQNVSNRLGDCTKIRLSKSD